MEKGGGRMKDLDLTFYFDAYGAMLTPRQSEVFDLYYHEDLSLGEIAALSNTTRQAVADTLGRARRRLMQCENGLGLVRGEADGL